MSLFFQSGTGPFTLALAVVLGLFAVEILTLLLGGSLLAVGADAPDLDLDMDADFDIDTQDIPASDALAQGGAAPSGLLGWSGLRDVPFLIWLVSFLTLFGLSGLIVQALANALTGGALPAVAASLIALAPALTGTRHIANAIARIMPKSETSAMKTRFLGGHHGVISQGTARRGKPAEARIKDRFGNTHYLRVEPLEDDAVIPQGAAVHVIRRKDGMFYVVDIS